MCETLDRRVPAIVQNIDGPSEITANVLDSVFVYEVDQDFDKDVDNFLVATNNFWETHADDRKTMAEHARIALDDFRPEVIKLKWKELLLDTKAKSLAELDPKYKIKDWEERSSGHYGN